MTVIAGGIIPREDIPVLKKLGITVDIVSNGVEAIKALESTSYDLVLMDVQMPELDGYETTGEIRNRKSNVQNHDVPIIALTANAMQGDKEKCIAAGMNDYLAKPVKSKALSVVLERWLGNG